MSVSQPNPSDRELTAGLALALFMIARFLVGSKREELIRFLRGEADHLQEKWSQSQPPGSTSHYCSRSRG